MDKSLLEQYQKQWEWRDWQSLFDLLPIWQDCHIYDLGCAHGDHSYHLAKRGAFVTGLDRNQDLLDFAQKRKIERANFQQCDLSLLEKLDLPPADGVWTSFLPAYFPNLDPFLKGISSLLRPGGWLAITEMSGLFDHEPLDKLFVEKIQKFYQKLKQAGSYDFMSGVKLEAALIKNNFRIIKSSLIRDREFTVSGALEPEIIEAWVDRLHRMPGLKQFMGEDYQDFESQFLDLLSNPEHISQGKVFFHLARKER